MIVIFCNDFPLLIFVGKVEEADAIAEELNNLGDPERIFWCRSLVVMHDETEALNFCKRHSGVK